MTDAPKKRPWLQFHLSTAVVLMFVAGGLLWGNLPRKTGGGTRAGWPFVFWQELDLRMGNLKMSYPYPYAKSEETGPVVDFPCPFLSKREVCLAVAADAAVALGLLFMVALILERHIRRKERRP